ncbi:tRNA pseudouridine synthase A [Methanimicrococcus sp. At1]|uniref:tRNA pseudouridine synthase A n=1 Tax=Methanimicrococcus hacksteinii TaxID=3028293 RepID=A0ABU3VRP5_9EURY|nr:tRNA pseudouridine(38-40) synthase TruA [Methanimicrococcus sp. At1]MDV0445821.1 tRNA pseudouridine synthase A [Methanimicrococcus sp. At1]
MKVALKIGYEGTHFSGSQIQPDKRTVEGELLKALLEIGVITDTETADLSSSGRTDAGVHSVSQVVTFLTDNPRMALPRILNSKLPRDVWAWAYAEVSDDFDPRRHAVRRKYRYVLNADEHDISKMRDAAKLFIGEHNFSNFAKKDKNNPRSTVRKVEKLDIRSQGPVIKIDIVANAYLWNMIRKIVSALTLVGNGTRDIEWIGKMLDPDNYEEGIEPAPAYGLIFLEVQYDPEPEWMIDNYAIKHTNDFYTRESNRFLVISTILEQFVMQPEKGQDLD